MADTTGSSEGNDHKKNSICKYANRRNFLLSTFTGGIATALTSKQSGRVSADSSTSEVEYDPRWYSVADDHWEGRVGRPRYRTAVSMRRVLCLEDIYFGNDANILEFRLFSFGLAAYDDGGAYMDHEGPDTADIFGNKHTIKIESVGPDDIDVRNVTTQYPLIGTASGENIIDDVPGSEGEWTTGLEDLEQAEPDPVSDDDLPAVLGAGGLALGLLSAAPPLGLGVSLLLAGTSGLMSSFSLAASLDNSGEVIEHTNDKWEYDSSDECLGGQPKGVGAYSQHMMFNVKVPHEQSSILKLSVDIDNSGCNIIDPWHEPHEWIGENGSCEWKILIPYQYDFNSGWPDRSAPVVTSPHPWEPYEG